MNICRYFRDFFGNVRDAERHEEFPSVRNDNDHTALRRDCQRGRQRLDRLDRFSYVYLCFSRGVDVGKSLAEDLLEQESEFAGARWSEYECQHTSAVHRGSSDP